MVDAPLRERVARLISQQRFEDARRTTTLIDALRAADAQVATIRRASRRTGVLLAADLDPRHVVAFAVARGALVAKRRLPRAGDPGLELGAVARGSRVRSTRRRARAPRRGAVAPGRALRRGAPARARLRGARAGRRPDRLPGARRPGAQRVEGARRRVPLREALPPGRHARADELAAVA